MQRVISTRRSRVFLGLPPFFPFRRDGSLWEIDLEHDRADRGKKVAMPLLVLWGQRSGQGSGYDVLAVWRDHAENVFGQAIASGHFLPEEAPDDTCRALHAFFTQG